jgi:hypothetical protein
MYFGKLRECWITRNGNLTTSGQQIGLKASVTTVTNLLYPTAHVWNTTSVWLTPKTGALSHGCWNRFLPTAVLALAQEAFAPINTAAQLKAAFNNPYRWLNTSSTPKVQGARVSQIEAVRVCTLPSH